MPWFDKTIMINNSEGFSSCLVLLSLLDGLWFVEKALLAYNRKLYFNYIYLLIHGLT